MDSVRKDGASKYFARAMLPLVVTISVLVFIDIATPSHSWKCLFPPSRVKFQGSQSVLSVQRRRELLLDGPTLEIEAGSMTVLTGPSGAGKTIWMKEMMACLNGSEQMGDGISCAEGSGAEKLRGVWCDRYTVSRSKQAPSVSLSIIESVESKLTPPCVLFVDELVDTESMPVRRAVYKGVNDLCREKMCAAVWATHKFEGLSGRRVGLRNGRQSCTLIWVVKGEGGGRRWWSQSWSQKWNQKWDLRLTNSPPLTPPRRPQTHPQSLPLFPMC